MALEAGRLGLAQESEGSGATNPASLEWLVQGPSTQAGKSWPIFKFSSLFPYVSWALRAVSASFVTVFHK